MMAVVIIIRLKGARMKVSRAKAAENREAILTNAARLFREKGVPGVGVDALAEAAGMTHGSLYSQFGSKDKLLAESLEHGFARTGELATQIKSAAESIALYLTPGHRDNPGRGCFMAALGGDMPRQSVEVRKAFTKVVKGNTARLADKLAKGSSAQRQDQMLATVASMVGAMVLARAVDDREFSDRILSATRSKLLKELR
jgi:TetR/AcrR family transcriptional regulator, transcriptional repressor for nem operon